MLNWNNYWVRVLSKEGVTVINQPGWVQNLHRPNISTASIAVSGHETTGGETLPEALRELARLRQWVDWRAENGSKIPYTPGIGRRASVNDPDTWGSLEETGDQRGFVFTENDQYAGVDLDGCRDPATGEITGRAREIVKRMNSYTEISPSGKGLHVIVSLKDKSGFRAGVKRDGVEVYTAARYFTVTGWHLEGTPRAIEERQTELEELSGQADKQDRVPEAGPVPSEAETTGLLKVAEQLLPDCDNLLVGQWPEGRVEGIDRSKAEYILARRLVEAGLKDLRTIAVIVYGSSVHRAKFAKRGEAKCWEYAVRDAARALTKEKPVPDVAAVPPQNDLAFPEDTAVGICADIARMFASRLEAPLSFWYNVALTCLGAAVSGCVTITTELKPQPRLYTVLIGPSAAPRKSTALSMTANLFVDALDGLNALHVERGPGSAEGLADALQRQDGAPVRCIIALDELKVLVQKGKIEHSILTPMLCSLYHQNDFSNTTKRSKIELDDAHISLIGACTEDTFATMWTPEFLSIGFINRLWLVPDRPVWDVPLPEVIPDAEKESLKARLRRLVETIYEHSTLRVIAGTEERTLPKPQPLELRFSEPAKALWEAWYVDRPRGIHADRLDVMGLRLMVLQEVSQGNLETVERGTVEQVIRLLEWQYRVRQAHDPVDAENKMARMEVSIRRQLAARGPLTERQLRQYTNASRMGLWIFNTALENLKRAGDVGYDSKAKRYYLADGA